MQRCRTDPAAPGDLGQRDQGHRVFGVRSWEVAFINRATNEDDEPQLRVTKGKTYNARGGVKGTDPRWLEAVAVHGTTFGMVENWDRSNCRPPFREDTRGCPAPSSLLAAANGCTKPEAAHCGTHQRRAHGIVKDDTLIAAAMGHTWRCITAVTAPQSGEAFVLHLHRQVPKMRLAKRYTAAFTEEAYKHETVSKACNAPYYRLIETEKIFR